MEPVILYEFSRQALCASAQATQLFPILVGVEHNLCNCKILHPRS